MIFGEGPIIKNIAGDLNKLFLQGTRAGQPINNVEGDAAADQATIQLMADRDPVIRDISTGLGWAGREVTVSGTPPLSLPNSLGKPLKAWSVDLLPYQEGSGDPSPDNVRPIHGTDKLTITTAGENLFDEEWELGIISNSTGQNAPSTTSIRTKNYIPISPNSKCTISWENSDTANIYALAMTYKADKSFSRYYSAFIKTFTFVPRYGECYIRFYLYNNVTPLPQCMINFGETKLPYTPYIAPSQTVLTLPQTVYTGTIGSDGGESRWGEVDLGTLNWAYLDIEGHLRFVAMIDAVPNSINLLCSCYKAVAYSAVFNNTAIGIAIHTDGTQVAIYDPDYTDATSFKAAMSGAQLVYELATPTTFVVPSVTIPTPTGTATTWATAEDGTVESMEVTYVGKV